MGKRTNMNQRPSREPGQIPDPAHQTRVELEAEIIRLRRELEIENSLEKVRARAMDMRDSAQLAETSAIMFQQMRELAINPIRASVGIFDEGHDAMELWLTQGSDTSEVVQVLDYVNLHMHPVYEKYMPARKDGDPYVLTILNGAEVRQYYQTMSTYLSLPNREFNPKECFYAFFFSQGAINLITARELSEEECMIVTRLAQVFGLIYTRFLDLKKAEMQTRQASVESSMERVRYQATSMGLSEEVDRVMKSMFTELKSLGIEIIDCGFSAGHGSQVVKDWTFHYAEPGGEAISGANIDTHSVILKELLQKAWEKKEEVFFYWLTGDEKSKLSRPGAGAGPTDESSQTASATPDHYFHGYSFGDGVIWTISLTPHSEEDRLVLRKFSAVFSMVYQRYLDLKRSEEQARIDSIDNALDRTREKAMAMQLSSDFSAVAEMMFVELGQLGIEHRKCGIALVNRPVGNALIYQKSGSKSRGHQVNAGQDLFEGRPQLEAMFQSFKTGADYFPVFMADQARTLPPSCLLPDEWTEGQFFGYTLPFPEGFLFGWQDTPLNKIEIDILDQFRAIAGLAARRFLELQKSETIARESLRQASLDRIRAEIASMRSTGDLERITPLIWNELTTIGVPFTRCGVFIMDEKAEEIQAFLSAPNGEAMAAFRLPFRAGWVIREVLSHWKNNELFTTHWESADFLRWQDMLAEYGTRTTDEGSSPTPPPERLDLHFFPFTQGMLYVGNIAPLLAEQMATALAMARAFATAYARYEDFNRLDFAKKEIENTLSELKQAQTRLVQSEKLASLGEMTAGIAHEIQNPLNFVNNFSEVNAELASEITEAAGRGDLEEVRTLASDIRLNQLKISEHGKRADAIVKSMLQHSRGSSGQKEPTDINALCEEYLRLVFHGMRARDMNFDVSVKAEYDPSLPRVSVIPQDIGRVVLNLLNNAFYAVSERKQAEGEGFQPEVTIVTRYYPDETGKPGGTGEAVANSKPAEASSKGSITISVIDNGTGIPPQVKDKIFQPFFTTKPTGHGTGLGLSMSYDIITKGHGGELRVETKKGVGSEFIVRLPVNV